MFTLPAVVPNAYVYQPGQTSAVIVDTGGYDFMVGGQGFRLATDQNFPYVRQTEPTTVQRFDSNQEPGEQSLSPLPWIKSQESFHGGAGQLNLEHGRSTFQYQQEQIDHIRFDNCLGVDVWTPGTVARLPDTHIVNPGFAGSLFITGAVSGVDYAIVGGTGGLSQIKWGSGADATPTVTSIVLDSATFGSSSNWEITSLATEGANYFAVVQLTADGSVANLRTYVVRGAIGSTTSPTPIYEVPAATGAAQVPGVVGWAKARLVAGLGSSFYELDLNAAANSVLPAAIYTHPTTLATYSAISESPTAILAAVVVGGESTILEFTLDSSGGTPVLSGGASIAALPTGECVTAMQTYLATFLGVGTTRGLRIGTLDTNTGLLSLGPLSVSTTSPVLALTARERFIYGGYTNQQADGQTGLVRVDLGMFTDSAGRNAYAPDLRPPTTAPTGLGAVTGVALLPTANRLVFITPEGVHVEGNGPGSDGEAWLRTSRIRYDTVELKLFKRGRIHGSLSDAEIQVAGITPFGLSDQNLGTYGFLTDTNDPGEFLLPSGLHEWIQLRFSLVGATATLGSYQVKALPAPKRQHIIQVTGSCFTNETDRFGLEVTDPVQPRQRYQNVLNMEAIGDEVMFVEFTNFGAVAEPVVIDQISYQSLSRPSIEDDFGGYITFKMRSTA